MICSHSDRMPSKPAACLPAAAMILTAFAWQRTASASSPSAMQSCSRAGRSIRNWSFLSVFLTVLSRSSSPRRAEKDEETASLAREMYPKLSSSAFIAPSIPSTRSFIS